MTLITERLELRKFAIADASAVHAYASDAEVCALMDWGPNTWDETLDFLSLATSQSATRLEFAVTDRVTGDVIGAVGGGPVGEGRWDMGWVFSKDVWGHGYATEAARALVGFIASQPNVATIEARCRPENRASARVMEKIGMHYVKRIKNDVSVRGNITDSLLYSIPTRRIARRDVADATGAAG